MIIRSDDYVEFCRDQAKQTNDPHDLAFRGRDSQKQTAEIQERIAEAVELGRGDDLVDIGCGDGTLLDIAARHGVKSAVGLTATQEEADLLRRSGFNVKQGLTHDLPLPSASASVVVCSCVLLVVPRERIPASLREVHRVAKPGARIYIGEIPSDSGRPPMPQFSRERELLMYLYRTQGTRAALGMLKRSIHCWAAKKPLVLRDGAITSFYAPPTEFIGLAQSSGLEFVRYWSHGFMGRNNYLFRKPLAH